MNNRKITELVVKAQKGDQIAMNDLVTECYNDIYYYVLKTVKNEDLAADVTQESFLKIITTLDQLREPEAFPLWARRIAYTKCAMHFRNNKEEFVYEENEEGETLLDRLPDESEDALPEQVLEDKEFRKTIMDMINSLPSEQTNALLLYYYEKLSVKEIADIQGTTEGTVKSRLNYARKAVKAKVEDYEEKTGTKLHSAAILPLFLRFVFAGEKSALPALSAPASLLAGTASTAATTATAATATAVAAKTAGTALGIKIAAIAVAAALVVGGTGFGIYKLADHDSASESDSGTRKNRTESQSVKTEDEPGVGSGFGPNDSNGSKDEEASSDILTYLLNEDGESYRVVCNEYDNATTVKILASYEGLPVTKIGKQAFWYCESLTTVIIPDSVTEIEISAFEGCTGLVDITIPGSVTTIESYAFEGCTSLTEITIPGSMTEIGSHTFINCTNLTDITIPDSVTEIGKSAFEGCSSLSGITIPDSVTEIGESVFDGCTSLTGITIPDSVTSIGIRAFAYCRSLTSITIPDSVTSIGGGAFGECTSLTDITIPSSVTGINGETFYGCTSLTNVTLPSSVSYIAECVFDHCTGLTDITYKGTNAEWKSIEKYADWDRFTPDYTVHCTDGDIQK